MVTPLPNPHSCCVAYNECCSDVPVNDVLNVDASDPMCGSKRFQIKRTGLSRWFGTGDDIPCQINMDCITQDYALEVWCDEMSTWHGRLYCGGTYDEQEPIVVCDPFELTFQFSTPPVCGCGDILAVVITE